MSGEQALGFALGWRGVGDRHASVIAMEMDQMQT
ncbi:hypothetical protein ABH926_010188 [Catenulispora sp. GP43]